MLLEKVVEAKEKVRLPYQPAGLALKDEQAPLAVRAMLLVVRQKQRQLDFKFVRKQQTVAYRLLNSI